MSYIFFVPPYNEHSGGTKVLYFTAAEMLKQGAKVRLWQNGRPVIYDYFKIKKWVSILRWFLKLKFQSYLSFLKKKCCYFFSYYKSSGFNLIIYQYNQIWFDYHIHKKNKFFNDFLYSSI